LHRIEATCGVRLWREEWLAYVDEPATSGYAEGVTNKVK
jgi:transposase